MDEVMRIAQRHNLYVIEDAAQSLGADYYHSDGRVSKAGTIGTIGTTSFFPSKSLGCYGDGGAIFTNDDTLADETRSIANHGMKVRYHHDRIGVNSRLDTIQAAILRVKLKYLNGYNKARLDAANKYDAMLRPCGKVITPARAKWSNHIFHQYTLKLTNINRDKLQKELADLGIPTMVYYPIPLHKQKAFEPYREFNFGRSFQVSDYLSSSVISLPMHTELADDTIKYITDNFLDLLKE
jgi:dTDP-4-amino-4,6-dideoxygalactose transaminase